MSKFLITLQSLQAHKSDNQQLKVKLRRLEEDNAKREKQIEELLDPTKVRVCCKFSWIKMLKVFKNFFCVQGSEYTRSLVDKKKDGSVVSSLILHINIHRSKKKIHIVCAFKCCPGCKWAETEDFEAGTAVSRKRKCFEV